MPLNVSMKNVFVYMLFIWLTAFGSAFCQNDTGNKSKINYADSAIYYIQKSQTASTIDTNRFYHGLGMIHDIQLDTNSIGRIDRLSEKFKREGNNWYNEKIKSELIIRITKSDSTGMAINYCSRIIDRYHAEPNPEDRIPFLYALIEIRIPYRNSDIPAAFDFYTSQLKLNLEKKDSAAISICYFSLGSIYRITGLYDMGIYNYKKARSYLNESDLKGFEPIRGLDGWVNLTSAIGHLYIDIGDFQNAIAYLMAAKDARLHKLKDSNISFINCNIAFAKLLLNDLDSVDELLSAAIPISIKTEDYPALAKGYEMKGLYFLKKNQLDSSEYYLLRCKEAMSEHHVANYSAAGIHTPNYYLAEVRILQNRLKDARALLEEELPAISKIRMEVLKEQKLLIEVYNKLGDSKAADSTFIKYSILQDQVRDEDRKNRSMSFEAESKITEAENTISDLETQKKIANLIKNFLIGIALLMLLVTVIMFNRFRVTQRQKLIIEKERQRSEELLLNILPEEVAEELKAKGSAEAKQFDEVTVMFTDFKGFTQISEKLTPSELVAEIHTCFKAFDYIISKYNIEKIKTIGDSYMCAGGLPVTNKSHADDVLSAALEIQKFMLEHLQQRKNEGKEIFEIRIGIHTGPVVAGIVGAKKFAYDIWGDTVNIASRMESSGEAGKVNISGSTYELVKDKLNCIYRGKIQAKNKGEIDMYFVESTS